MTYVILNTADITQAMLDDCVQSDASNLRKSLDGTQAILKYSGQQPASLSGRTEYTHVEIQAILSGVDWADTV